MSCPILGTQWMAGRSGCREDIRNNAFRSAKMREGDQSLFVTRREFTGELTIIWVYMCLLVGEQFQVAGRWTTGILWIATLGMLIRYTWLSSRPRAKGGSKGEPTETDKRAANQPD